MQALSELDHLKQEVGDKMQGKQHCKLMVCMWMEWRKACSSGGSVLAAETPSIGIGNRFEASVEPLQPTGNLKGSRCYPR